MPAGRLPGSNTESVDNYLKAIFSLGGPDGQRVMSKALADRLGVAPASVTNMLQKLAGSSSPLVEYERHRGVLLSVAGKRRALEIVRHHRLIETFLYEILDYPLDEVHEEAERLEHFISERFEERIAAKLGHPTIDPHGHSIPTMEGEMPKQSSMLLSDVVEQSTLQVDSVSDRSAQTLRCLEANGITPGVRLCVKRRTTGDSYRVNILGSDATFDLSQEDARDIRIIPLTE